PQGGHPDDLRGRLRADLPARGAQLGRRAPVDAEQHPVLGRDGHRRDAPVHPQGRLRAGPLQRRGRRPREVLLARADPAGEGRAARLRQVPGGARDLTVAHGAPRAKTAASWSLPLRMNKLRGGATAFRAGTAESRIRNSSPTAAVVFGTRSSAAISDFSLMTSGY